MVALMCLVMETPAKLKKAMENTIRDRSPQRVPEFDIWVKASEKSEIFKRAVLTIITGKDKRQGIRK